MKTLRQEGLVPANIYGKDVKSTAIQLSAAEFEKVFTEAGETSVIEVSLGKEKRPVLVHGIQKDPTTENILHIDFHQINLKEKVKAGVPVELVGEAPAEKRGEGTLVQYIDEIEVESLPGDLPEKFEVDVTGLEDVDSAIYVKDLAYDKSRIAVEVEDEEVVAKVEPLRKEEEVAPPTAEEEVVEGEGTKEEQAEESAEGEKKEEPSEG